MSVEIRHVGWPPTRREVLATILTAGVIVAVAWLGLASQPGGGPIALVERWSAQLTGFIIRTGSGLSLGIAFIAGLVAAFNPCGFPILPAYLGLYLSDQGSHEGSNRTRVGRALVVSAVVAGAFVVLFGLAGLLVQVTSSVLGRGLTWIGLVVGFVLVIAGGWTLAGRGSRFSLGVGGAADRLGRRASRGGLWGYGAFGLAYGAASLGCTLPLFLAVMGTTFATGTSAVASGRYISFALGMATSITVVTVSFGLAGARILRGGRRAGRLVTPVGGILLMLSGAYVAFYWLSLGRLT
ncbi:MAG: cytochrome c biogenesis protein CcdA [Actinomycetota bacterium]